MQVPRKAVLAINRDDADVVAFFPQAPDGNREAIYLRGSHIPQGMSAVGSKPEILTASRCFPLCPSKRTSGGRAGMSVQCQQRTHAQRDAPAGTRNVPHALQANVLAEAASIRSIICGGQLKRGSDFGPQCLDDSRPLRVRRMACPATSRLDRRKPI